MELPRVLVAILDLFKFLWTFFTGDSTEPVRLVNFSLNKPFSPEPIRLANLPLSTKPFRLVDQPSSLEPTRLVDQPLLNKPFRLIDLPSLAHDVIFPEWSIKELYHLSKCSRRSRYVVKMFARRQKYDLNIHAKESSCSLGSSNRLGRGAFYRTWMPMGIRKPLDGVSSITYDSKDVWAATKAEVAYFLDVFTKKVNRLEFYDTTNVTNMTEFLKENRVLPVDRAWYDVSEIDDEMYKYVLREYKHAKKLTIRASPSADFRFDDMEPFTGDAISIKDADWLTFDNLTRCFMNVEKVWLWTDSKRCLNALVFNQFLNAWINGLRVGKLDLKCGYINIDLESIFNNVPTTEVKRAEVGNEKRVFKDGQCFLIRQKESGMEAIVYFSHMLCFTTNFRLLSDDESDEERRWNFQ